MMGSSSTTSKKYTHQNFITCSHCGNAVIKIIDSRPTHLHGEATVRRRRKCRCGNGITTYELTKEQMERLGAMSKLPVAEVIDLFRDAARRIVAEREDMA